MKFVKLHKLSIRNDNISLNKSQVLKNSLYTFLLKTFIFFDPPTLISYLVYVNLFLDISNTELEEGEEEKVIRS